MGISLLRGSKCSPIGPCYAALPDRSWWCDDSVDTGCMWGDRKCRGTLNYVATRLPSLLLVLVKV